MVVHQKLPPPLKKTVAVVISSFKTMTFKEIEELEQTTRIKYDNNGITRGKNTILHYAIQNPDTKVVKKFLQLVNEEGQKIFDINTPNNQGITPFMIACSLLPLDIITQLTDGNIYSIDNKGNTIFHYCVYNHYINVIIHCNDEYKLNINAINNQGITPLMVACKFSDAFIIGLLIRYKADVKMKDNNNDTAIHYIMHRKEIDDNIVKILEKLIKKINIDEQNNQGVTPLMMACKFLTLDIVGFLLRNDADVNAKDKEGNTPMHYALHNHNSSILKALLTKDNSNAKNNQGVTLLMVACGFANINDNSTKLYGDTITQLLDAGADVNVKDKEGNTPMHYAVRNTNSDTIMNIITILKTYKVELNAQNNNLETPLDILFTLGQMNNIIPFIKLGMRPNIQKNDIIATFKKQGIDIVELHL